LNHLLHCQGLNNRYFAVRHGNSLANQQGIIVSHPRNGVSGYGLSKTGRLQVIESVGREIRLDAATIVVSSDFRRARETAGIIHDLLNSESPPCIDQRLRERNFGELELGADNAYAGVWREDEIDADNHLRAVESPNQVMARVSELILDYESRCSEATVLLVSHGDALQILQTAFARQDASQHRRQRHLETAEIRLLLLD
jgi:probable phosphoglycerate mutase